MSEHQAATRQTAGRRARTGETMRQAANGLWGVAIGVLLGWQAAAQAAFIPWGPLTGDSWIAKSPSDPKLAMHTVNGGDYAVGFDQAATGNKARGLNALTFSAGGSGTVHRIADTPAGSLAVANGGSRTFRDLLVLVAIDAPALPGDFAFSLGVSGQTPYDFNPSADLGYYDQPTWNTGRPSGYYSVTNPAGEGVAYDFAAGMVTVWAAQNVNLGPGGTKSFDYAFTDLPGTAVFSVYGFDESVGWICHTNRAVADLNQSAMPVSTFEVAPEPATLALLAGGAVLAVWRRSRRRRT